MRIDYSEPRRSLGTNAAVPHTQRKAGRPFAGGLLLILLAVGLAFGVGFGSGWYFSQQAAKKSFRAAMEQQSLESAPKTPAKQPEPQQPPEIPQAQAQPGQPPQAAPAAAVPLSFFESLPKGQKQTVLGSGVNKNVSAVPTGPPVPQQQAATVAASAPKPAEKTVASEGYLVQVAAFATLKEAQAAKVKLAEKGFNAAISETKLADTSIWYRVRIGRHLTKDAAQGIASRVGSGSKILPDQD